MFCLIEKFSFTSCKICKYKFFMIYVQVYVYYKKKERKCCILLVSFIISFIVMNFVINFYNR